MSDLIKRSDAIKAVNRAKAEGMVECPTYYIGLIPSADRPQEWIPCSERLPEDIKAVNITWVNHNPVSYYEHVKDMPFVGTAHYGNGKWWWESPTCEDYLAEYGESPFDEIDKDIEVIAWMPLPKPMKGADDERKEE